MWRSHQVKSGTHRTAVSSSDWNKTTMTATVVYVRAWCAIDERKIRLLAFSGPAFNQIYLQSDHLINSNNVGGHYCVLDVITRDGTGCDLIRLTKVQSRSIMFCDVFMRSLFVYHRSDLTVFAAYLTTIHNWFIMELSAVFIATNIHESAFLFVSEEPPLRRHRVLCSIQRKTIVFALIFSIFYFSRGSRRSKVSELSSDIYLYQQMLFVYSCF